MAITRTFSIIKPDATRRNITGKVNAMIEGAGLRIVAQKRLHLTQAQANTVHGSDSDENAAIEIAYFFAQTEIVG